jgi:hypothetical protein
MPYRYDQNGKIFTNIIAKDAIEALVQTITHRVSGMIYFRPGERLKDELNRADKFIAVTNATVYNAAGEVLYRADFLSINRDHIVWLLPRDDNPDQDD